MPNTHLPEGLPERVTGLYAARCFAAWKPEVQERYLSLHKMLNIPLAAAREPLGTKQMRIFMSVL